MNDIPFKYSKGVIPKEEIERAMRSTLSNKAAARYLHVTFPTYKKYASFYKNDAGITLFDLHKNECGRGIKKKSFKNKPPKWFVADIIEGRVDKFSRGQNEIKEFLIKENFMREKCYRCGFEERRQADYKIPVLMNYLDGDKNNWKLANLEFLCYNCYFIHIGDVFSKMQVKNFEHYVIRRTKSGEIDMELPIRMKDTLNKNNAPREALKDFYAKTTFIEEKKPEPLIELPPELSGDFTDDSDYTEDFGSDLISRM